MTTELTIYPLPPDEWERVQPFYAQMGAPVPPDNSIILVVEYHGEIVGMSEVYQIPVAGQFHVDERVQGAGVGTMLAKAVLGLFNPGESLFTIVSTEAGKRLAEAQGFAAVAGQLMRRVI